jgi:hypothetical protein
VVISVDGKPLRGTRLPKRRQVHLLSAYDTATSIVLDQACIALGMRSPVGYKRVQPLSLSVA